MCKLRMRYKNYTVIEAVRSTTYRRFSTCGPRPGQQ